MNMNPGDEAQFLNPSGQATDASAYIEQELRLIGSGQGLSYETTSRDMSESNYSSARQGMIEDELTYIEDREQILEILDEIYETFVISCALTGRDRSARFLGRQRAVSAPHMDQSSKALDRSVKRGKRKQDCFIYGPEELGGYGCGKWKRLERADR